MEKVQYNVGNVVRMKKAHPCGSYQWQITRTGMDFGIRCQGCGRFVLLSREKFQRQVKCVVSRE